MNRNLAIIVAVVALVMFLLGFLPQYTQARRSGAEAAQLRKEARICGLKTELGSAFLQASLKNYGLAGESTTRFFEHTQAVRAEPGSEAIREKLDGILAQRDEVTAALARGDAGAFGMLQRLYGELLAIPR